MFRTMPLNLCKPWTRKKKEKEKDRGMVHSSPVRPHAALSPSKQRLSFFVLPGCFFFLSNNKTQQSQIVCEIISSLRRVFGSAEPLRCSTWRRRRLSAVSFSLSCQPGGRARPTSAPAVRCNASLNVKRIEKTKDEKCVFIPPSQTVCWGRTAGCDNRRWRCERRETGRGRGRGAGL